MGKENKGLPLPLLSPKLRIYRDFEESGRWCTLTVKVMLWICDCDLIWKKNELGWMMLKDDFKLICSFNSSYINKRDTERRGIKKQLRGEVGLFTENFQPLFCNQKCKSLAPGKPAVGLLAHKQEVQTFKVYQRFSNTCTRGSRQAGSTPVQSTARPCWQRGL